MWVAMKALINDSVDFEPAIAAALIVASVFCLFVLLSPGRDAGSSDSRACGPRAGARNGPISRRPPRLLSDRRSSLHAAPPPQRTATRRRGRLVGKGNGSPKGGAVRPRAAVRRGSIRRKYKRRRLTRVNPIRAVIL